KPGNITDNLFLYDMVIIPGGKGFNDLIVDKSFMKRLSRFGEKHAVGSVCTGLIVLEEAGLLKEKKSIRTNPEKRVVVDGKVFTAGHSACSIDLGLKILELKYDEKTVKEATKRLDAIRC
ncbi:MAG: hypothetical protein FK732_13005, partial [Asgard group archaeon]|nr:hypothetical protein [Asgard group archaeon]